MLAPAQVDVIPFI